MKKIIPLLLVIAAVAIVFGISQVKTIEAFAWRSSEIEINNAMSDLTSALSGDSTFAFHRDEQYSFFGSLTLTGYVINTHSACGDKGQLPCDNTNAFDYAYFNIVRSDWEEIFEFLELRKGKAFVINRGIGLGCYEEKEGILFSRNSADRGTYNNLVTGKSLEQLMASGPKNYIQLKVTRPIYTGKKPAPYCYSLFREFTVLPALANPETGL
jgi:hypothetical protein